MDKFLSLSKEDQNLLVVNTANKLNMPEAIIEKDFWVCWFLDYLFTDFKYKDSIYFKGGTSLSKVYHCIERFSEDIDLALDWSVIGIEKKDAYTLRSKRQQEFYNKSANEKTERYLKDIWLPLLKDDLSQRIQEPFNLYINEYDGQTICFQYPRIYLDSSILQVIRLEIGVLAEPIPANIMSLESYIGENYSHILNSKEIEVKVVDVHRTFFEKITILHREAKRTNGNYPSRYSRHFYDVYQMIEKGIANESVKDICLLKKVVEFKKKFYPCNWAEYDDIFLGKCVLIPSKEALKIFSKDYDSMKNMFYGHYPSFDEIIDKLKQFEIKLNNMILKELFICC